ncbi:MAG: hypothetical protein WBW48_21105 [Anaerolineae bacterium]
MKVGLLWFDDDRQWGIEEKVHRAAKRYREKFGRAANTGVGSAGPTER